MNILYYTPEMADLLSLLPFGLGLVFWKGETSTQKKLTIFLGVEALYHGLMYAIGSNGINNMFLVHINTFIIYIFMVKIFSGYFKNMASSNRLVIR